MQPKLAVMPPVVRSEGQRMLLCVTGSLRAIAAELGCKSTKSILDWRTGEKPPGANARARMWTAFGIPVRAWSVQPGGSLDEPRSTPLELAQAASPVGAPSTLEDCLALLNVIRRDRSQQGLMPSERVKLADAEARILGLRARLEQAAEFAESRYVHEHPSWIRLRRAILHALEPHPAAAKAVVEALASLKA